MARVTTVQKAMKDTGRTCGDCHQPVLKGEGYRWAKPGFRAAKIVRHLTCKPFRASDLTGSANKAALYGAQEAISDTVSIWDAEDGSIDDLREALETAAETAREVAEEYETAAEAMGAAGDEMRDEYATPCEEWAEALESAAGDLTEFDPEADAEEDDDEDAVSERRDTWADEQRSLVEDASGELGLWSKMNPESSLPFFFYGTLMEGEPNASMLPSDVELTPASVTGYRLHYATPGMAEYDSGYPVAVRTGDPADVIRGEVAWLDITHRAVNRMTDMEIGAGYKVKPVHAVIENDNDWDESTGALIFEYPTSGRTIGRRIRSGDWRNR